MKKMCVLAAVALSLISTLVLTRFSNTEEQAPQGIRDILKFSIEPVKTNIDLGESILFNVTLKNTGIKNLVVWEISMGSLRTNIKWWDEKSKSWKEIREKVPAYAEYTMLNATSEDAKKILPEDVTYWTMSIKAGTEYNDITDITVLYQWLMPGKYQVQIRYHCREGIELISQIVEIKINALPESEKEDIYNEDISKAFCGGTIDDLMKNEKEFAQKHPQNPLINMLREYIAGRLEGEKRLDEAMQYYQAIANWDKIYLWLKKSAWSNIAGIYRGKGDLEKAIELQQKVVQNIPHYGLSRREREEEPKSWSRWIEELNKKKQPKKDNKDDSNDKPKDKDDKPDKKDK